MLKRCVARAQEIESRRLTDLGLIVALIAVVCAGVLTLFGESIEASIAIFTSGF